MSVLERCLSYKESNKGNKKRQGPTLGVRFTEVSRLIEVSVKRESTVLTKKLWSFYSGDMKTCPLESSICLSICLARTRLTNTLRPTNSYFSFVCIWIIMFVQSSIYWLVMLYIVFMVNIYDSIVIFLKQKGPDFGHFYYHTNFWVFLSFSFFLCVVVHFCGVGMITQFFSIFCIYIILWGFVPFCNTKKLPIFLRNIIFLLYRLRAKRFAERLNRVFPRCII